MVSSSITTAWRIELSIILLEDNKAAGDHRTTKHIDTKTNFVRDAQTNGYIKLVYVPKAEQLADGMTKTLPFALFQTICLDHYLHRYEFDTHW